MATVLLINTHPPEDAVGGAEVMVGALAAMIAGQGHRSVLATMRRSSPVEPSRQLEAVERIDLDASALTSMQRGEDVSTLARIGGHLDDLRPGKGKVGTERVLARCNPDIVITNNLRGLGAGCIAAVNESGRRWTHIPHDLQLLVPSGLSPAIPQSLSVWDRAVVRKSYQARMRRLFRNVNCVWAPSQFMVDAFESAAFFPGDIVQKRLLPHLELEQSVGSEYHEQPINRNRIRLALIGRLTPHKGIAWAVRVLREWNWPGELVIDVCGTGEDFAELSKLRDESRLNVRINLHGHVSPNARGDIIDECDVVIVPSIVHESFSFVVHEANERGKPVLGSRAGAITEFLHHDWVFPPGDDAGLIEVLERFANMRPRSTSMTFSRPSLEQYAAELVDSNLSSPN